MKKRYWLCAACAFAAFLIVTALVLFADVQPIGEIGNSVGCASLNGAFADWIGFHDGWYTLSELLGYLALLIGAAVACLGLYQWIKRKKLFSVDREILALGVLYAVTVALYVFFEVVVICERPILVDGEAGASFPSSHTLLALVLYGSAAIFSYRKIDRPVLRNVAADAFSVLALLTVVCRLFSGVHWLTDIFAGILLGASLLLAYRAAAFED